MLEDLRVALFSDVHANAAALAAVLDAIDRAEPDLTFFLGDLVGRGPEPERVTAMLERREIRRLRGNWDEWVAGLDGWDERPKRRAWVDAARALMRDGTRARLADAPQRRRVIVEGKTIVLAHGSPRDPVELLGPDASEDQLSAAIAGTGADVVAIGHSHKAFVRSVGPALVVNPGTVGYAFNGDPRASFAILDVAGEVRAEIVRVPYRLDDNLHAMRELVRRRVIEPSAELRYRRALLGDGPEPTSPLAPADRGAEALVKLLAPRIRAVYQGPPIETTAADAAATRELRAAVRRLREALALARPLVPPRRFERARRRLTELGRALGLVRSTDVLLGQLAKLAAREPLGLVDDLRERVHRRKRRATGRLAARYAEERRVAEGLDALALTMRPERERAIAELAPALFELRARRIRAALPRLRLPAERESHHRLRIQLRRMRYLAAILAEPFRDLELGGLQALAKSLHTELGELNDAYELTQLLESRRLRRLAHDREDELARLVEAATAAEEATYRRAAASVDASTGALDAELDRVQRALEARRRDLRAAAPRERSARG